MFGPYLTCRAVKALVGADGLGIPARAGGQEWCLKGVKIARLGVKGFTESAGRGVCAQWFPLGWNSQWRGRKVKRRMAFDLNHQRIRRPDPRVLQAERVDELLSLFGHVDACR